VARPARDATVRKKWGILIGEIRHWAGLAFGLGDFYTYGAGKWEGVLDILSQERKKKSEPKTNRYGIRPETRAPITPPKSKKAMTRCWTEGWSLENPDRRRLAWEGTGEGIEWASDGSRIITVNGRPLIKRGVETYLRVGTSIRRKTSLHEGKAMGGGGESPTFRPDFWKMWGVFQEKWVN